MCRHGINMWSHLMGVIVLWEHLLSFLRTLKKPTQPGEKTPLGNVVAGETCSSERWFHPCQNRLTDFTKANFRQKVQNLWCPYGKGTTNRTGNQSYVCFVNFFFCGLLTSHKGSILKTNHAAMVLVLMCSKTKPIDWIISDYLRKRFITSMMINGTLAKDALELWEHHERNIGSPQFYQQNLDFAELYYV